MPLLVLLAVAGPATAQAGENDFRLNAMRDGNPILFQRTGNNGYAPIARQGDGRTPYESLVTELGYVFSPRLASPAETLGHAGFHVSAMWSGTNVSNKEDFWYVTEAAQDGGKPNGWLHTLQLDVRKGLPWSFEIGVNFMWLADSELFAPGLEIRWALQEGYKYVPDFGVRGSVNHMVGNRDLLLTTVGIDAVLSKSFGLGGMVNLAPYVSWSFLLIAANSRVIDPTPMTEVTNDGSPCPGTPDNPCRADIENNFVFEEDTLGNELHHKLTIGLRAIFYVLNVSVQGEFQMLSGDGAFGPVATISTKLGLDF